MDVQSDSTSRFRDHSAGLESIVDAFDRVVFHGDEEAGGELRTGSACIEKSGGSMCEMLAGHEIVCFDDFLGVVAVNTNCNSHNHVLRTFSNLAIDSQKVRSLQSQ